MVASEEHLREMANGATSRSGGATKKFNGRTYVALGEYWKISEASEVAKKLRGPVRSNATKFSARVTPGSFIGSWTVWIRRK